VSAVDSAAQSPLASLAVVPLRNAHTLGRNPDGWLAARQPGELRNGHQDSPNLACGSVSPELGQSVRTAHSAPMPLPSATATLVPSLTQRLCLPGRSMTGESATRSRR
jgi:hypothetical protein